ncbi:sulfur carrier protein ThiS [Aurantimonas sp. Leaf443]|uniref:sulfur carrier protein ThiS n=1 Tax=Aurantimonas sp. Leaf443 TaxID=1736378 RepID=UPI00070167AB|nr:sulfur carrier protein ThiS [Aurantimonas sp. Leaf443]KQT83922.1 thiamine biosynthesis protein ThiS [Aurantimonas sp. Leaf443]
MNVTINGEARLVEATTLQALLAELGHAASIVATARNGEFVAISERGETRLREGDRIEILAPMKGG